MARWPAGLREWLLLLLVCLGPSAVAQGVAVEAGPIWNNADARGKCPRACASIGGHWTGDWRTTRPGTMSVCTCDMGAAGGWPGVAGQIVHYPDTDFPGSDIRAGHADDFQQCAARCLSEPRCVAFTLSPARTCYLKTAAARARPFRGAESGFVSGRGTPPNPIAVPYPPGAGGAVGTQNACSVGGTGRCPGCSVSCPADRRPVCTAPIDGAGFGCQRDASCRCAPGR